MVRVTSITDDYQQRHILPIAGFSTLCYFTMEFSVNLNAWFFSLEYGEFAINGNQLVVSENLLRQWANKLPFGLAVTTKSRIDPVTVDAFSTGEASLYITTADDVAAIEATFYG